MTFVIAINYGGRDELRRAFLRLLEEKKGSGAPELTEEEISDSLDTAGIPDPDLLIRTSGELRLSNFLLWQLAYSELYVTPLYWPDFNLSALEDAILAYNQRERRFGGR